MIKDNGSYVFTGLQIINTDILIKEKKKNFQLETILLNPQNVENYLVLLIKILGFISEQLKT